MKLEHVELRVFTDQVTTLGEDNGSDDYCRFTASLVLDDFSGDVSIETTIGTVTGYKIREDQFNFETMDEMDSDTAQIGAAVSEMLETKDSYYDYILVIDKLRIDPKFRNQGYGFKLVKGLVETLARCEDLVVCIPGLIDDEAKLPDKEQKKLLTKLKNWWRKVGFKPIEYESSGMEVFAFEAGMSMEFKKKASRGYFVSFMWDDVKAVGL